MKQFNVKNIALAAMLMCSVGDALGATTDPKVSAVAPSAQDRTPEASDWVREHRKTLFAGLTTAAIAAFAVYATACVQKIKKQLKKFQLTPRNNKAMQLRAELNNWLFLRNISWVACAAAGGLTALGTAHHVTKDCLWATNTSEKRFWPKLGRRLLGHSGVKPTEESKPSVGAPSSIGGGGSQGAAGAGTSASAGAVVPPASTSPVVTPPQAPPADNTGGSTPAVAPGLVHPTGEPASAGGASGTQQPAPDQSDTSDAERSALDTDNL